MFGAAALSPSRPTRSRRSRGLPRSTRRASGAARPAVGLAGNTVQGKENVSGAMRRRTSTGVNLGGGAWNSSRQALNDKKKHESCWRTHYMIILLRCFMEGEKSKSMKCLQKYFFITVIVWRYLSGNYYSYVSYYIIVFYTITIYQIHYNF